MRIRFAAFAGIIAVWAMGPVAAYAFEQTPLAPAPPAQIAIPAEPQPQPDLFFGGKITDEEPNIKGREFILPGVGKLSIPDLNFGLDLMYGSTGTDDPGLGFSADTAADDDLTILGTFKRQF